MTNIQTTISDLTNIEADKLRIRVDLNKKDEVVHIIVVVDDKKTAEIVSSNVNIAISEGNPKVRQFKRAEVKVKELEMSSGMIITENPFMIVIAFMTLLLKNREQ